MISERKRKPQAWHLKADEVTAIKAMSHRELVDLCIKQKEQVNRVLRVLVKLRQAISELVALGS